MISGKAIALPLMLAALLRPATGSCAAPELDALLRGVARPAPATTPFIEVRYSRLLERPLVVAGVLEFQGPDALARTVTEPFRERTEIRGENVRVERAGEKPRRFSLKRAPELRSLLASFAAVLGGDRARLEQEFALELQGDERSWQMVLTPRDPRAQRRIRDIAITGHVDEPRCLVASEPDGDASVLLVGDAAKLDLHQAPGRARLEAICRGDGA